jgi:hypothetical protein
MKGIVLACEICFNRKKAEADPKSLLARIWRWRTVGAPVRKHTRHSWPNRRNHDWARLKKRPVTTGAAALYCRWIIERIGQ